MKTLTQETSALRQFGKDSSKRDRALEKFRRLNEATLKALREAGLKREAEEKAKREQPKTAAR